MESCYILLFSHFCLISVLKIFPYLQIYLILLIALLLFHNIVLDRCWNIWVFFYASNSVTLKKLILLLSATVSWSVKWGYSQFDTVVKYTHIYKHKSTHKPSINVNLASAAADDDVISSLLCVYLFVLFNYIQGKFLGKISNTFISLHLYPICASV